MIHAALVGCQLKHPSQTTLRKHLVLRVTIRIIAAVVLFEVFVLPYGANAQAALFEKAVWETRTDHEAFHFNTSHLSGTIVAREQREEFKGSGHGLRELIFKPTGTDLHPAEGNIAYYRRHRGLLNLYRVYSKTETFGALRDDVASVRQLPDGAELTWEANDERPVKVKASWRVTGPAQIDFVLEAWPSRDIEKFEILLANYVSYGMTKGVYLSEDGSPKATLVRPGPNMGGEKDYAFFPMNTETRKNQAQSGKLHSSWKWPTFLMSQNAVLPMAYAADDDTQIVMMADVASTSAVCVTPTPAEGPAEDWTGVEKHSSQYFSLFCRDVKAGEKLIARARVVIIEGNEKSESKRIEAYRDFISEQASVGHEHHEGGESRAVVEPNAAPLGFPHNRLRDYYINQARQILDSGKPLPDVLPQFPGLDGGAFGHWGNGPENENDDHTINDVDFGGLLSQVVDHFGEQTTKAVSVSLGDGGKGSGGGGDGGGLSVLFDPEHLTLIDAWRGDLVRWDSRRFGVNSGVEPVGEQFADFGGVGWQTGEASGVASEVDARYLGFYRAGGRVVFSYRMGAARVFDHAYYRDGLLGRSLRIDGALPRGTTLTLMQTSKQAVEIVNRGAFQIATLADGQKNLRVILEKNAGTELVAEEDRLVVRFDGETYDETIHILVGDSKSGEAVDFERNFGSEASWPDPQSMTHGGVAQWGKQIVSTRGKLGDGEGPYVIDTLTIPYGSDNPFGTPMRIGGMDILPDGRIAVCTLVGDVWLVDGIDDELESLQWKRIAAGLHQPLGLVVKDGKILVLGRDQITRLHDLNGDDEVDFYECVTNDFPTQQGNSYASSLHQVDNGDLYWFTRSNRFGFTRFPEDGKPESIATGLRGSNGTGVSPDGRIRLVTAQEGTYTPATAIFEVGGGSYHGFFGPRDEAGELGYQLPLCFIPRGIDNSSGDIAFVPDDSRWGPLAGKIIGTSLGTCQSYMVLRETVGGNVQGGVVPLAGDFLSGAHRTRFSQRDGHFYVAGTDGWASYAQENGSLQRVRYTGGAMRMPVAVETRSNGLIIRFNTAIDPASVRLDNIFAQQWNYLYSKAYGSAEYSVKHAGRKGHDPVDVRSVHLLDGGRAVFVEIPQLHPVMQMHLYMRLASASGEAFESDLYYSIFHLGEPFTDFEGYQSIVKHAAPAFPSAETFPIDPRLAAQEKQGKTTGGVHALTLKAVPGLRYEPTELKAPANTLVALKFENKDVEMPHNLVFTYPHRTQAIGEASMLMAADPNALAKHYVPQDKGVLGMSPLLMPGEQYTVYFMSPKKPGDYPFICTFPGHWQIMRGVLHVTDGIK